MLRTKYIIILSILFLFSFCEKHETEKAEHAISPKLLVSIKKDGHRMTEFLYDSLNRLAQMNQYQADTLFSSEFFFYDEWNKLIRKLSGNYTTQFTYDENGRLKSMERYYAPTDKTWLTEYIWTGNRITGGTIWFEGVKTGILHFAYDSNGNTSERTEFYGDDFVIYRIRVKYDKKVNPLVNPVIFPPDMVQFNNPVYLYIYRAEMSSLPPEYDIRYEYDSLGLPVKEYRIPRQGYSLAEILDYEYIEKRSLQDKSR